jgi:predicted transcriptional regulator
MTVYKEILDKFYTEHVKDVMNPNVWDLPIVEENTPIEHILSILRSKSHVWVVNSKEDMLLKGVIGQLDIIKILLPPEARTYRFGTAFSSIKSPYHGITETAKDVMTRDVIHSHQDDEMREVIISMNKYHLRRLPVVNNNHKIIGQITLRRIILAFTKMMDIGSED